MPTPIEQFAVALRTHAPEFGVELTAKAIRGLGAYYALLLKWNPRLHLVAPCSPEEFATRHVLESLLLLKHLPQNTRVADVGSGGGLPIIPCLLARDDLLAVLIESSTKKSIFLREALRAIQPATRARVINARFEDLPSQESEFITCRALDRFAEMLPRLVDRNPGATLVLFGGTSLREQLEALHLDIRTVESIPNSERRFLIVASGKPPN
jgi:16S rRNA (guanine527-N7)-methyltransferase